MHFLMLSKDRSAEMTSDFEQIWPSENLSQLVSEKLLNPEPDIPHSQMKWEQGQPDFKGVHSFDNILNKLSQTIHDQAEFYHFSYNGDQIPNHGNQINNAMQNDINVQKTQDIEKTDTLQESRTDPKTFDFVLERISASLGASKKPASRRVWVVLDIDYF